MIGAFGRLIVGNYDKKFDAFFTTHTLNSFEDIKAKSSFIPRQKNLDANILMSLINNKPLNLEINKYPINEKAKIVFKSKISKNLNKTIKIQMKNILLNRKKWKNFSKNYRK